jgi:uncharacterized pyridoxal phosphate-containing UPF0001 family protein
VQISYDEAPGRGGVGRADADQLAELVAATDGLHLLGAMTVAPRDVDPAPLFADLVTWVRQLRIRHPDAAIVSAGMTGDLEAAVHAGATCLRVGTALFGNRRPDLG